MCILCVVSRWSRRVVTMLPWLVIPFIITWAFSQLLPPGYRLEVTSTRLACLGVLLSSLGWYELLMPWLSAWRARRSAMLREKRLIEAQEAAKWRKEATRRCRNCLTAYKVQTPGCGKFMCTYCGHVSKRPFLEVPPSLSQSGNQGCHSGSHLGGQLVNGAHLRSSIARNDMGCWTRSTDRKYCWFGEASGRNETCKAWHCFLKVLQCVGNLFLFLGSIWRRLIGASRLNSESSRGSHKGKDDVACSHESRSEKARKRAYEKRQARLERELREAEERKQREEVAQLVEERRRQRAERVQVEKNNDQEASAERERENRRIKEAEKCRKDKMKERSGDQSEAKTEQVHVSSIPPKHVDVVEADKINNPVNCKTIKHPKGTQRDQSRAKATIEVPSRTEFLKYGGSLKQKQPPVSKASTVFQKHGSGNDSKVDHTSLSPKVNKVDGSMSTNNVISRLKEGEQSVTPSAWMKAPWYNAWAKGSEVLRRHCSLSHANITAKHGDHMDLNRKDGGNPFNNKAVGAKQSSSGSVGSTQPPIAPPSTQTGALHQLFSSPTIFPPLDLTHNLVSHSQQMLHGEIQSPFGSGHTFFEAPVCANFQSCTGVSTSSSPCTPAPVLDSLFAPQHLTESSDEGSLHSTFLGSSSFPDFDNSMDVQCSSMSTHTLSVPDGTNFSLNKCVSPHPQFVNSNMANLCFEVPDDGSWELSSISLEKMDGTGESGQERSLDMLTPCDKKLPKELEHASDKMLDSFQLPHISTVESLFDSEILLPESLALSPQTGSNLQNGDHMKYNGQGFDGKSLWSAYSAAFSQIWDDADNNQKLPPEFVDCITQEIMRDPVITADGHSYERTAIEKWLNPKTGEVLPPPPGGVGVDKTLRPNHILRGQIIEYNEKLAKMQRNSVSWSNSNRNAECLGTSVSGVRQS
ncbi:hypothetical protein KP509_09G007800 [Ceratopteris richardii]|uniref:U-box domain-containing protein n=1 Tax=Ceratopteris richardii TaxID=49495 RepID=A0A8T2U4B8_CERRI|nr:hypothetical protein KP509_09G007800 [Ceratopteris richardii]